MCTLTFKEAKEKALNYIKDCGDSATREGLITHLKNDFGVCDEVASEIADELLSDEE